MYKLETLPDHKMEAYRQNLEGKKIRWLGIVQGIDGDGTLHIEMDLHMTTKTTEYDIELPLSRAQNYNVGDGVFVSGTISQIKKIWWVKWVAILQNKSVSEPLSERMTEIQMQNYVDLVKRFPRSE